MQEITIEPIHADEMTAVACQEEAGVVIGVNALGSQWRLPPLDRDAACDLRNALDGFLFLGKEAAQDG